jgi:hypothetical protein
MTTRPERNPQIMAHLFCSMLCDCSGRYVREIGWPLGMRLRENGHNWKERLLQRLKRVEHSDRSHRNSWNESRILKVQIDLLKPVSCFMHKIVFNINNSELLAQIAFFFYGSRSKKLIFPCNNISWLVFITESKYVYCEVLNESNITQILIFYV